MLKKMFQSLAGNVSAEQRAIDKRNQRRRELCVAYAYNVMCRNDILRELAEIEGEANKAAVAERLRVEFEGGIQPRPEQAEIIRRFTYAMHPSGIEEDDIGCSGFPAMRTPTTDAPFYADGLVGQWDRPVESDASKMPA